MKVQKHYFAVWINQTKFFIYKPYKFKRKNPDEEPNPDKIPATKWTDKD